MKTKQKQIVTTPEQIKPRFKVGDELIDLFNDKLKISRIYIRNAIIEYAMELVETSHRNEEKMKETVKDNLYEEDYIINVLMVKPI